MCLCFCCLNVCMKLDLTVLSVCWLVFCLITCIFYLSACLHTCISRCHVSTSFCLPYFTPVTCIYFPVCMPFLLTSISLMLCGIKFDEFILRMSFNSSPSLFFVGNGDIFNSSYPLLLGMHDMDFFS